MNRMTGNRIRTVLTAFLVALVLAASVAMVAAARTIELGPRLGDILVFRPGAQLPPDWEFTAITQSNQLPVSCKLKPEVMAAGGGSVVVEERSFNRRVYRVHWAGQHTSKDAADCGQVADLLVSRGDLQLLSNAVGGPGVEQRRFLGF